MLQNVSKLQVQEPKTIVDIEKIIQWRDSSYSNDLYIAAVSWLDLFTWLDGNPATERGIIERFSLKERPAQTMLRLFEAWTLLSQKDGRYHVSNEARRFLSQKSPENVASYIATMKYKSSVREIYDVLRFDESDTWHVERGIGTTWDDLMQTDDFADLNTRGMEERGRIFAPDLTRLLDCSNDTKMLDIGGGSGIYSAHLLNSNERLSSTILERPPVDDLAKACLQEKGLLDSRAFVSTCDMFVDSFPADASLHLYSHVLHNWGFEKVALLLAKSHEALAPGGRIAVYSCHPDDRNGQPAPALEAEYSVLLTTSYEGRCYSFEDMRKLFEGAGFQGIEYYRSICNRSLIIGHKST